jgi:hypothetical protein
LLAVDRLRRSRRHVIDTGWKVVTHVGHDVPVAIAALDPSLGTDPGSLFWQFSMRPAVPEYWRCTPQDFVPFFTKPVSSSTNTACSSPRCATT